MIGPGRESTGSGNGLNVTVLDVGQGLAIVLECDGKYALYDGGPGTASSTVISYLERHVPDGLEYAIASHYDEDHLNGIVGALHRFPVGFVLAPDYQGTTDIYQSFIRAMKKTGTPLVYASAGQSLHLGEAVLDVLMPISTGYVEENDYSVVVRVVYGDTSILLTGDCTTLGEYEMIFNGVDLDSDILVVGHHGSEYSTSRDFLEAVDPEIAIISCGRYNTYGHPSAAVMSRLDARGIEVLRTDTQGDLLLLSDGSEWYCTPASAARSLQGNETNETLQPEPPLKPVSPVGDSYSENGIDYYIVNTRSMKFHRPGCVSAAKMSERNKKEVMISRDELIAQGYIPCGNCQP